MQSRDYENIAPLDVSELFFLENEGMVQGSRSRIIPANNFSPKFNQEELPSYSNWGYCYIDDEQDNGTNCAGYLRPTNSGLPNFSSRYVRPAEISNENIERYYHYLEIYYQNLERIYSANAYGKEKPGSSQIFSLGSNTNKRTTNRPLNDQCDQRRNTSRFASIFNSPVISKLKDLRFNYLVPDEGRQNRFLYLSIIGVLLTLVIALCLLHLFLPKIVIKNCKTSHRTTEATNPWNLQPLDESLVSINESNAISNIFNATSITKNANYFFNNISEENINDLLTSTIENSSDSTSSLDFTSENSFTNESSSSSEATVNRVSQETINFNLINTTVTTEIVLPRSEEIVCQNNQFKCEDGVSRLPCLYNWERCDGVQDCSDGSDEVFCDELRCYGNFMCDDGSCTSLAKVCNGIYDCKDGSDEMKCSNFTCQFYEYRCKSGYCIPKEWVCDGEVDCPNHEEEYNCSKSCSDPNKFMCPEGWCIPAEWKCNGIKDCAQGDDEQNCSCSSVDKLQCSYGGGCIDKQNVCDGIQDCADGSDEFNCVSIEDGVLLVNAPGAGERIPVCSKSWTSEHADAVCQQLGYSKHLWLDEILINDDNLTKIFISKFEVLPPTRIETIQFAVKLSATSECASGKIVALGCQTNACSVESPHRLRKKRIVGGNRSQPGQWPSVGVLVHTLKKWACTATIIAPFWVITSALCVKRTDPTIFDWKFVAGSNDPSAISSRTSPQTIRKFVHHPSYKFKTIAANYDVMLVQLEESLPLAFGNTGGGLSSSVSVSCLSRQPAYIDDDCVTVGFGYTSPGGYFINKYMNHLSVRMFSRSDCNATNHYAGSITDQMLCAEKGNSNSEVCANDEGSPLLCRNGLSKEWFLAGVLTTHSCGSKAKHPALYADIFPARRWIFDVIGQVL